MLTEIIEALDDLQHNLARGLDLTLKNDEGDCFRSSLMLRDFDALSAEIQQAKRILTAL